MNSPHSQQVLISTTKYAVFVMLLCYLPHFFTAPWWMCVLVLSAMGYRLLADYYGIPMLNKWIRFTLVAVCLVLLKVHYGSMMSSGLFIGFLLTFIGLKIIEIHHFRDLKVLALCNFYLIFSALLVIQELWIILYLIIGIITNLSLMLKLTAPQAPLNISSGKSIKLMLIGIPLSIILFYIFPRMPPLWQVPSPGGMHTGFSEQMNPGSIADLIQDDTIAMRVTFNKKPVLNGYWRGLILSLYNGISWNHGWYDASVFPPLQELSPTETADYEVLLEPHQKKWLFYLGYPEFSRPTLLFSVNYGLISQNKELINQRVSYALKVQSYPYHELSKKELIQTTQLPGNSNPRLTIWAKEQFAQLNKNPQSFIAFLKQYINEQSFWYSLTPPVLMSNKNQMDQFWFDTQKGFCEHYASAVTVILRSVGIPARIVVGYQGGEWNPLARYLTIRQNDAHAWLEYWQEGIGWQEFDPTLFIASERIEPSIQEARTNRLNQTEWSSISSMSWLQRSRLFWDSVQFFAERWLLFYNQDTQRNLLEKVGLEEWRMGQLLQASIVSMLLFIMSYALYYQWRQRRNKDPLLIEYHLLQKEFKRFNVSTHPSATLKQQCHSLSEKIPALSPVISIFLCRYETLRLKCTEVHPRENKKQTILLFKTFRRVLSQKKSRKESTQ
ncbi:DUF3488 domain-containing protein [Legionella sp. km535]|uniref:transglutaminase family protein n=1 Tax=Legionella sp. km535 TaxID=2498107 RepID=UPI000F8E3984|nr:DUF3488 and transglutaminase-like domain-containing protein [Legionella sp. km535]RUR18270.1 DUF3488 domain-containing protein [Legionella sp. km535]